MTDYAIETLGLGHRYKNHWAVEDVDLQVPRGSVFGLLGANGAGKSTSIHMLMGLLPPAKGQMNVLGLDPAKDHLELCRRVGYVPENHGFYEWMKVGEIIAMVSAYHAEWNHQLSGELVDEFALDPGLKINALSKGMRAKLALLLALSFEPEMLILDEPAGGLDAAARRSFIETVLSRYQQAGKTILVSSHLLNEFSGLLDHVAFLSDGVISMTTELDRLHERMKRVHLEFDDAAPTDLDMQGMLSYRASGREAMVVLDHYDEATTGQQLTQFGPARILVEELTLEDIFVETVNA
jgi:ABC-2 type transport system ATP-binding protein